MFIKHPDLDSEARATYIDWIFNVIQKARIEDKNVFYNTVLLFDTYYLKTDTPMDYRSLRLSMVSSLFITAKILEI